MVSHFSCIGVRDPHRELGRWFDLGGDVVTDAAGAQHILTRDPSGAAIVAHVEDHSIVCATPFFFAPEPALWRVRPQHVCVDVECVHCSGVDVDVYAPGDDADSFSTRCGVQLIRGRAFAEDAIGAIVTRRVVAFAHAVRVYDDVDAFHAPEHALRVAVPSFFPVGMFGADDDLSRRACATFTGVLRSAVTRFHTVLGGAFTHLVVDGLCGPIDVVADAEVAPPPAGAVVQVDAWMAGDDM